MYTDMSDELIKRVVRKAFPNYTGRKVEIVYNQTTPLDLRSFWQGGSRTYHVIMRLSDLTIMPVSQNGSAFDRESVDKFTIPAGFVVVDNVIYCGKDLGIKIYTPASPLLDSGNAPELTLLDQHVLIATASLKSSYAGISDCRAYELHRKFGYTKDQVAASKTKLQGLKYLDKRNAITNTGRNVIANHPDRNRF